jgi:hypothetical protein
MTPEEGNQVAYAIYQNIFNGLTKPPQGQSAVFDADGTFLCLQLPAQGVSAKYYTNPWTPGNTTGDFDAARKLASLVDAIPAYSPRYTASGRTVSQIYGQVVNARVKQPDPDPEFLRQYEDADKKLYRTIQQTDPETGEKTERRVRTPLYQNYVNNRTKYDAARAAFGQAFDNAMKTPETKGTWPIIGSVLEGPVRDAFDQLQADGADEVEQALNARAQSISNVIGNAFRDAQFLYQNSGVNLSGQAGAKTWRASTSPSDWYDPKSEAGWTELSYNKSQFTANSSSEATSWGGSAGVNLGLFSFGASAGGEETRQHSDTDFDSLQIAYDFLLVTIDRLWVDFSLFTLPKWDLGDAYPPGGLSKGPGQDNSKSVFPLYPIAFVAVKNVRITANWGASDRDAISKAIHGGGSVGYGPFSIGGNYSNSSTEEHFHARQEGNTVIVDDVQIIGWICRIVPFAPPPPG